MLQCTPTQHNKGKNIQNDTYLCYLCLLDVTLDTLIYYQI
jgi:hypothetical protein